MKYLLSIVLFTISTASLASVSCATATESVQANKSYLWTLKLNTIKVSDAVYSAAYNNYLTSVQVKEQVCTTTN